jgi:hypothetical protein
MFTSRRGFLEVLGLATGGLLLRNTPLGIGSAHAAGTDPKFLLLVYFSGGWDQLLSLDPRNAALPQYQRVSGRAPTSGIEPAYAQTAAETPFVDTVMTATGGTGVQTRGNLTFGPAVPDTMLAHSPDLCVIRGMNMDTLTHEAGLRRFLTGQPPSGLLARGSSMNTALAAQLGIDAPIPNRTMNCETYNADQPAYASALQVKSVDDLLRVLRPGDFDLVPNARARVEELLAHQEACGISQTSPTRLDAYDFRLGARDLVQQNLDELFDFAAGSAEMTDLRARYGFTGTSLATANAAAAMAATAITSGITRCCSSKHRCWALVRCGLPTIKFVSKPR